MEIVFSNPCFLGDILCTLPMIEIWKKRTGAKITLLYEDVYKTGEPKSILDKDPYIDEQHQLPFNTIPRGMDKPTDYIHNWVESYLGRKVDKIFDLHKNWTGSNGDNWFRLSELDFKEFTKLKFYPSEEDYEEVESFKDYVGLSHRLVDKEQIMKYLDSINQPYVVISERLGFNMMQIYCMIDKLKLLITPACVHNTLCWVTETPNILTWNGSCADHMTFDFQNNKTQIIRPYNITHLLNSLALFLKK